MTTENYFWYNLFGEHHIGNKYVFGLGLHETMMCPSHQVCYKYNSNRGERSNRRPQTSLLSQFHLWKVPYSISFCDKFIDAKFIHRSFRRDNINGKEKITKRSLLPELVTIADTVHYALSPTRSATWDNTYSHNSNPKTIPIFFLRQCAHRCTRWFYADFFRALSFGDAKHETLPYCIGLRYGYEGKH